MEILVIVDMQNDFLTGALGNEYTKAVLPKVCEKVREYKAKNTAPVVCTMDTHYGTYLDTIEGTKLPIPHCIKGTEGWKMPEELEKLTEGGITVIKETFGGKDLPDAIKQAAGKSPVTRITICGVCTDICVISNAMLLKAYYPNVPIRIESSCCAGVSPESHQRALEAMKVCHIEIV